MEKTGRKVGVCLVLDTTPLFAYYLQEIQVGHTGSTMRLCKKRSVNLYVICCDRAIPPIEEIKNITVYN